MPDRGWGEWHAEIRAKKQQKWGKTLHQNWGMSEGSDF